MGRVSVRQMYVLLDFLEKHPSLAKGTMRGLEGRHNAKRLWRKLADMLNTMNGTKKTPQGWSKFWSDKKCSLKRNASYKEDPYNGNSDIDKRILALTMSGDVKATKKKPIKRETSNDENSCDEISLNGDLQEELRYVGNDAYGYERQADFYEENNFNNIDNNTMEETSVKVEEQPIINMEERQMVLMEKLVQAMNQQSAALAQLAQASDTQAFAMERLAEASHMQAKAVERLANSFEVIGSVAHNIRDAIVNIDMTMKRCYGAAPT